MASAPQPFLIARQLAEAGRLDEARAAYGACLQRHAGFLPAYLDLSDLLVRRGEAGAALQLLGEARARADGDPHGQDLVMPALANLLAEIRPRGFHPRLQDDLLACFHHPNIDSQRLARVAAALLLLKHPEAEIDAAGTDPLWIAFLTRCINVSPAMEARLIAMRTLLLERGDATAPLLPALALQAFASEYAWPSLPQEPEGAFAVLVRPLIDLALAIPNGALWDELGRRTRDELIVERDFALHLPGIGEAHDAVSTAVRTQYEEHPYPRWQAPPASPPADLRRFLAGVPGVDPAALPKAPLRVLIAGCGTGYEAIDVARMDPGVVTALDLSRASLAFANRKAVELGVANIRFLQADILALDALGDGFGLVISTGVLHHMERPEAGLASLVERAAPGGVLRLSLYSRRARRPVLAARALIRERGWQPNPEGIRAFRAHVLALPADDPLAPLRDSDDFYSLSGCRDLVFHAHEHQFALPEIGALVASAGLRFAALDAPPAARSAFHAIHGPGADPLDLGLWDAVEERHPFLFAGMYQFLCQKPSQASAFAR